MKKFMINPGLLAGIIIILSFSVLVLLMGGTLKQVGITLGIMIGILSIAFIAIRGFIWYVNKWIN